MGFLQRLLGSNEGRPGPAVEHSVSATPTAQRTFGRKRADEILSGGISITQSDPVAEALRLRAEFIEAAGPYLGPALQHIFDETSRFWSNSGTLRGLISLFTADKTERGKALALILHWLVIENRHGDLQKVGRSYGRWAHEFDDDDWQRPSVHLQFLAFELAKDDLDLAQRDRDHARLVALLGRKERYATETSRKILRQLLKTVATHSDGETAGALRELRNDSAFGSWRDDIDTALARSAMSDEGSVDHKSVEFDVPPIALPDISKSWKMTSILSNHFDNLLDIRLYDAAHMEMLNGMVVARAALIARRNAVEPFVRAHPKAAQTLGKLATSIANKSAPSEKWLAEARDSMAGVSSEERLCMLEGLTAAPPATGGEEGCNEACSRAIIYLAADLDPARAGKLLADFALKQCYQTRPGHGILAEKLGNACLWALSNMPDGGGVPYLARILARTKYPKIRAKVDAALNEAAEKAGVSRAALDELIVPTHDLDANGEVTFDLDGGCAVIALAGNRDTEIRWLTAEGKAVKAPTVAMKQDKAVLKAVKEIAREIEADLGTQVIRLQRLWLEERQWPAEEWRERYLEHPLLRALSCRLIWWVEKGGAKTSAIPHNGLLSDADGNPVDAGGATIRLWHPIDDSVEGVRGWRDRIEALQVVQPFAQAWREIYRLTDAERATGTYSNRWAGHILKQHQAMTLARLNRWTVTHRMWVDAPNDQPWHLHLPAHGLVVDYWVEGAGGDDPEVTDTCAYVYVTTDRVAFCRVVAGAKDSAAGPERREAAALEEVPVIVFSEVMRHCDLLTGVASIASDPQWLDAGADAHHPNQWRRETAARYWTDATTTTDLEGVARIRRELLERIMPKLVIAGQLSLDAQALVVQGKVHRYRIHLGSAAVYIAERNQHVCIVPAGGGAGNVWLPFDGDRTLSIILSKAFLLAKDDKITDPVILRQI